MSDTAIVDPPPARRTPSERDTGIAMDALRRIVLGLRSSPMVGPSGSDISGAQLFVLREIGSAPGLSLRELARRTLTRSSAASEVVTRLVHAGLVERRVATDDQRRAAFTLTPLGERAIAGAPETVPERLLYAFGALDGRAQRCLARHLEEWVERAGLNALPPAMFLEAGVEKRAHRES